jgi:O-acetyl-ADP-ribose deacetylase (regulator of RNase III)/uncharacterized protein YwgA
LVITVKVGDIFESRAQTLTNTVNTVGVMGKGIALGFKQRFPEMFRDYLLRWQHGELKLGRPYLYKQAVPPWILNFPTKEHWRSAARLDAIEEGLLYLRQHYEEWGIVSLAVPPLGCGEGRLDWTVVGPRLYRYLSLLNIPVELYAPFATPAEQLTPAFLDTALNATALGRSRSRVQPSAVALVEVLSRIEREPYHYPVGHVGFQKLAYFASASGIPTELNFVRSSYGPFAAALKDVTAQLVNNGLLREEPSGPLIRMRPGPTYSDARERLGPDLLAWEQEIDDVVDLLVRMNGKQAEIAATVHFAADELKNGLGRQPMESEILKAVLEWKVRRRPPLVASEIAETIRKLNVLGWISARYSPDLPVRSDAA